MTKLIIEDKKPLLPHIINYLGNGKTLPTSAQIFDVDTCY